MVRCKTGIISPLAGTCSGEGRGSGNRIGRRFGHESKDEMKQPGGGQQRYESWVRDYGADIYRCALRLCGHVECAEELTQEVFFEAWRSMDSPRDPNKARVWLLSVLRNRYMHWLRDEKRRPKSGWDQRRGETLSSGQAGPEDALARQEALQAALDALDDRYKVPFLLVFLEGFTCQQTTEFLEIPLGTVLSRIHRARQFLREYLEMGPSQSRHLKLFREDEDRDQPPRSAGGEP